MTKAKSTSKTGTQAEDIVVEQVSEPVAGSTEAVDGLVYESQEAESAECVQSLRVIEVIRSGATAAEEAVADLVPSVGHAIRQVAYKGIYGVAYGVTFGALLVAKLVPSESFVGHALADGSEAAKASFRKQVAKAAADDVDSSLTPSAA